MYMIRSFFCFIFITLKNGIHIIGLILAYCMALLIYNFNFDFFHLNQPAFFQPYDTVSYIDAVKLWIEQFQVHPTRCIGYSSMMSPFYILFGYGKLFIILIQVVQHMLLCLSFILIFTLIKKHTNQKIAWFSFMLLLSNVSYFIYGFFILTEVPHLFTVVCAIFYFDLYLTSKRNAALLKSFLAICMATLLKPGFVYLAGLSFLGILIFFIFYKKSLKLSIYLVLILSLTLGLQMTFMKLTYQTFKLSYIDDITTYRYLNTSVMAYDTQNDCVNLMQQRDTIFKQPRYGLNSAESLHDFHQMVSHESKLLLQKMPLSVVAAFFENIFSNVHTGNKIILDWPLTSNLEPATAKRWYDISRIWNMLLSILLILNGFIVLFVFVRRRKMESTIEKLSLVLLVYCGYSLFITGVTYFQGDRFAIAWMPFVILLTVFQLKTILTKYKPIK